MPASGGKPFKKKEKKGVPCCGDGIHLKFDVPAGNGQISLHKYSKYSSTLLAILGNSRILLDLLFIFILKFFECLKTK